MTAAAHALVLVRHGETAWSRDRRHTGRTDLPLTELGRRQADALGRRFANVTFARVLCSPLQRAVETCSRVCPDVEPEFLADAVEWDYGVYEGRRTDDIRKEIPGWSVWTHEIIGGETVEAVGARADHVIAAALGAEGQVAVFSHAHLLRILGARWIGLAATSGRHLVLEPAAFSVLSLERDERVIERWNDPGGLSAFG